MALIEQPDAANRLAGALLADLQLYNQSAIDAGTDLTREVDEARSLFRARSTPALHPIFERAIADSSLARYAVTVAPTTTPESPTPTAASGDSASRRARFASDDVPRSGSDRTTFVVLMALIAIGIAIVVIGFRHF